jgi:hypothetical protein
MNNKIKLAFRLATLAFSFALVVNAEAMNVELTDANGKTIEIYEMVIHPVGDITESGRDLAIAAAEETGVLLVVACQRGDNTHVKCAKNPLFLKATKEHLAGFVNDLPDADDCGLCEDQTKNAELIKQKGITCGDCKYCGGYHPVRRLKSEKTAKKQVQVEHDHEVEETEDLREDRRVVERSSGSSVDVFGALSFLQGFIPQPQPAYQQPMIVPVAVAVPQGRHRMDRPVINRVTNNTTIIRDSFNTDNSVRITDNSRRNWFNLEQNINQGCNTCGGNHPPGRCPPGFVEGPRGTPQNTDRNNPPGPGSPVFDRDNNVAAGTDDYDGRPVRLRGDNDRSDKGDRQRGVGALASAEGGVRNRGTDDVEKPHRLRGGDTRGIARHQDEAIRTAIASRRQNSGGEWGGQRERRRNSVAEPTRTRRSEANSGYGSRIGSSVDRGPRRQAPRMRFSQGGGNPRPRPVISRSGGGRQMMARAPRGGRRR